MASGLEEFSQTQVAELLGRSQRWVRESDCPVKTRNGRAFRYDPAAVVKWFVEHELAKVQKSQDSKSEALEEWRAGKAELVKLQLEEKRGTLKPISQIELMLAIYVEPIRDAMTAMKQNHPQAHKMMERALARASEQYRAQHDRQETKNGTT